MLLFCICISLCLIFFLTIQAANPLPEGTSHIKSSESVGNCEASVVEIDCMFQYNISTSALILYVFVLTKYMQKRFNTACSIFMSKKYLFLSLFGCSKVHLGLVTKSVAVNSVYFFYI